MPFCFPVTGWLPDSPSGLRDHEDPRLGLPCPKTCVSHVTQCTPNTEIPGTLSPKLDLHPLGEIPYSRSSGTGPAASPTSQPGCRSAKLVVSKSHSWTQSF